METVTGHIIPTVLIVGALSHSSFKALRFLGGNRLAAVSHILVRQFFRHLRLMHLSYYLIGLGIRMSYLHELLEGLLTYP